MSEGHKASLAEGRKQARIVRAYLEALEARRPGKPITTESLTARLERIERQLSDESDVLVRLKLAQAHIDVTRDLAAARSAVDLNELAREFTAAAKTYGDRKGIGYAAWRESGVPASVLKRSGIKQTRNRPATN